MRIRLLMACVLMGTVLGGCDGGDRPTDAGSVDVEDAGPGGDAGPNDGGVEDGGTSGDAGIVEPRPCELPSDVTNRVDVTIRADDWSFTETYQQWYTTVAIDQTVRQGEHFGVRVVFEGRRPRHEPFLRRHDTDPDDDMDDSVPGNSSLMMRVHQETDGTSVQPLWYDAHVPTGYFRPTLATEGDITESAGGFVTGYNSTVDYTEFGLDTRTEGDIECAVIWGTPLFPPPIQSYSELDVSWQILWAVSPADRDNADGYSPLLVDVSE